MRNKKYIIFYRKDWHNSTPYLAYATPGKIKAINKQKDKGDYIKTICSVHSEAIAKAYVAGADVFMDVLIEKGEIE